MPALPAQPNIHDTRVHAFAAPLVTEDGARDATLDPHCHTNVIKPRQRPRVTVLSTPHSRTCNSTKMSCLVRLVLSCPRIDRSPRKSPTTSGRALLRALLDDPRRWLRPDADSLSNDTPFTHTAPISRPHGHKGLQPVLSNYLQLTSSCSTPCPHLHVTSTLQPCIHPD